MKGKLNIQQIADQTGLSISTVSRVLAGKNNTSTRARERVMECAKSQGIFTGLSTGRLMLNNIMIFAPARAFDVRSDIFYYKVVQGILAATAHHEVRVRYCAMEEENADAALFIAKMTDPLTEAALKALAGRGPVILPLFSPRSARLLSAEAGQARAPLWLVPISPAAGAEWRAAQARLAVAPTPDAAGILRAIATLLDCAGSSQHSM